MEPAAASGLVLIVWQGWGVTGSIAALAVLLTAILVWLLPVPATPVAHQLGTAAGRYDLRARLGGQPVFERYRIAIRRLNGWLDLWFGPSLSGQAFERCLAIAFVYPVTLFLVASFVRGIRDGGIGAAQLTLFALAASAFVLGVRGVFRGLYWLGRRLWGLIGGDPDLARLIARVVLGAFAVVFAFALAFAVASSIAGAFSDLGTVVFAILGGFAFALAFAIAFAVAGRGAFVIALVLVTAIALTMAEQFAFFLLLFFIILPVFNAVMDWLSWAVTRFFLLRVADVPDGPRGVALLASELLADLTAAVLLLFALAITLPNGIELINAGLALFGREPFAWRPLVTQAVAAPWAEGLFVTGMVLTPLVPTLVHMTMGLAGILARWTPRAAGAVATIPEHPDAELQPSELHAVRSTVRWARFWYLPCALAAVALLLALSWVLSATVIPAGEVLRDVAFCATAWSQGQCAWL